MTVTKLSLYDNDIKNHFLPVLIAHALYPSISTVRFQNVVRSSTSLNLALDSKARLAFYCSTVSIL